MIDLGPDDYEEVIFNLGLSESFTLDYLFVFSVIMCDGTYNN